MLKALKLLFSFICFILLSSAIPTMPEPAKISEEMAEALGIEAYIYGYPLVTMKLTRQVMTNTVKPENHKAPMGQFFNARIYPDASFRDVTAPNADTLYSTAWLDLSKEPYILHVPNENNRYYLMPMLSAWTEVFAAPGTRTTGTQAADFAITGPDWHGTLPTGMKEFKSPTNLVWILGRTYCSGTPEDYQAVHNIQDQYTLTPLSYYGKPYSPPPGTFDANIDINTAVRNQVNALSAENFFNKLAELMKMNPPAEKDSQMVAKMAKLGIIPGQRFEMKRLDPKLASALERVPKLGFEKIMAQEKNAGKIVNGWLFSTKTGIYGTDYLQRAYIAAVGLGANLPADAIYPMTGVDSQGAQLDGSNRYMLHFVKNQTPPVKGFWSLTMYDDQMFFVPNALNRFSISPRDNLKYNPDGSLDLYVQKDSPGSDKESNWLPAPSGPFNLMFRFYWPQESLLNGTWKPPRVQKVAH